MMDGPGIAAAYCGEPPTVDTLAVRWIFDPIVLLILIGAAALYLAAARRAAMAPAARAAFLAGWAIAALALLSPLCALSVSLFSARTGQHLLLALAAAPLIAAGRPLDLIARLSGLRLAARAADAPVLAAIVFAATIWLWQAPQPYAATFQSDALYWIMHVTTLGAAVWLWSAVLRPDGPLVRILSAALFSTVQMSLLGALITFAPRPLYAPHLATAQEWGMTALADQQLGGALMWGPGCAVFLLAGAAALTALLREDRARPIRAAR